MSDSKNKRVSVAETEIRQHRQNSTAIELGEGANFKAHLRGRQFSTTGENASIVEEDVNQLKKNLSGRHMQMIAIGGAIGAGVFVGTGNALATGGPGSLVIGFIVIGVMMLCMMQALGELAVMYPINGAFYSYMVRFIDPSWGFAIGWQYAIQWLTILPYEISAAGLTIRYWDPDGKYNIGIWIAVFIVALTAIQFFGVRGYGEVEFVLSTMKSLACIGFIIFAIVVDCGGIPGNDGKLGQSYIGTKFWRDPGAFANGFKGFCSVFVTASFAYGGTELTGLAAAEAENPVKQIPKATKQVFWRIAFFYVVNLFLVGLIVPYNSDRLLGHGGASTKYSPFVIAITETGVRGLPSVFNAVITISVISVANSATYASTRTLQALATQGMAPKLLAYVDKKGRPIPTVVLQLVVGLLAFVNEAKGGGGKTLFNWLLALTGIANFFVYGSICVAHIRFRAAWLYNGHSLAELPYKAAFGIWGSYLGLALNVICLIAQAYVALFPIGAKPSAYGFFEAYLAAPIIIVLYIFWKAYSWVKIPSHRPLYVKIKDVDIYTGMREGQKPISGVEVDGEARRESVAAMEAGRRQKGLMDYPKAVVRAFF